ncbi:hypothetical protein PUG81_05105 [Erwiniaceae bacterium L1_54_6]|nr:hypothetical protein [Erwiniaceae bacterium L1_54_6]
MDKFDRVTQRRFLQALYEAYPDELESSEHDDLMSLFPDERTAIANLLYLEHQGLIRSGLRPSTVSYVIVNRPQITHQGIDFIRDDGGLGAILNVQTIKFHDSTIMALEDIILVANAPEEKKSGLISKLRELPADAIKHLTLQLLSKGVLNLPAALQLIEKALH